MVTATGFYQLNYTEQADMLLQDGMFLLTRTEGNFVIDLYELHDLMVEIFYHKESEEPVSVMAYNTADKLKTMNFGNLQPRLTFKDNHDPFPTGSYAA